MPIHNPHIETGYDSMMKICAICIFFLRIPSIRFDDARICNYCKIHNELKKQ